VDENERKRLAYIATTLADAARLIHVMLLNLDGISLAFHGGPAARDRIADDFMLVYANILPGIDAPLEVLAVTRSVLLDWVTLDSLVPALSAGTTTARAEAAEELANRVSAPPPHGRLLTGAIKEQAGGNGKGRRLPLTG
jgi:hypothetical protein